MDAANAREVAASGDPTMGGRTTPDGTIAFTPFDHIYANVFPTLATLTPEDPLTRCQTNFYRPRSEAQVGVILAEQ